MKKERLNRLVVELSSINVVLIIGIMNPCNMQLVEKSPDTSMNGGGKGDGLAWGQMQTPTCAELRAVFHTTVRPPGDGVCGSH